MYEIFICYRREDSEETAGRLFMALSEHYGEGRVFLDDYCVPTGKDFNEYTCEKVAECRIVLVLFGRDWLSYLLKKKKESDDDYVLDEIETAIQCQKEILPIFVRGATPPKRRELPSSIDAIARKNGLPLNPLKEFRTHFQEIVRFIDLTREASESTVKNEQSKTNESDTSSEVEYILNDKLFENDVSFDDPQTHSVVGFDKVDTTVPVNPDQAQTVDESPQVFSDFDLFADDEDNKDSSAVDVDSLDVVPIPVIDDNSGVVDKHHELDPDDTGSVSFGLWTEYEDKKADVDVPDSLRSLSPKSVPEEGVPLTQCSTCQTVFEVPITILNADDSRIRCGECLQVFDASESIKPGSSVDIKVPTLPESVPNALILIWHKQPGDSVTRDEVVVELETDKVVLEVPALVAGVMGKIIQEPGTTVVEHQIIGKIEMNVGAQNDKNRKKHDISELIESAFEYDLNEMDTMMDLAKAYIDMGDKDSASSALGEIVKSGNAKQRREAETLLRKIT